MLRAKSQHNRCRGPPQRARRARGAAGAAAVAVANPMQAETSAADAARVPPRPGYCAHAVERHDAILPSLPAPVLGTSVAPQPGLLT
eukprot:364586-Chlamydomonas_euryale.AAC.19